MPISKINTFGIADNAVISSKIAQDIVLAEDIGTNQVTINELAPNAVTSAKIVDGTIITTDLADDAVETIKIKDLNVTTAKIADANVTNTKIAANAVTLGTQTTGNYMSNVTAGTGISVSHTQGEGSNATISLSGGTLVSNDSVTLGTHTTGNYMSNVTAGTGISISHTQSEGSTATISINQPLVDVHQSVSYTSGTNDFSLNLSNANSFTITLTQNSDIIFTNVPTSTAETFLWTITIIQGSSNYSVVYPTNVHWPNGQKPTLSSASGAIDQFVFMKSGATGNGGNIYGFTVGQDIKAPASP